MAVKQVTNLAEVRRFLRSIRTLPRFPNDTEATQVALREHKIAAIQREDQALAKEIWCFEQILKIQSSYLDAFTKLKGGQYYDAWCVLEQIEVALSSLDRHLRDHADQYALEFIRTHCERFQSLFPYRMFFSTEFIHKELKCSICNATIAIRNPCGHRVGEIYNGDLCIRIVADLELMGISLVTTPRHKYSVGFAGGSKTRDTYDYSLVRSVVAELPTPFQTWSCDWTRRRVPHSAFRAVGRNDPCPCESGKKYKTCCLKEPGVLRPHCVFQLGAPTPDAKLVDSLDA